MQLEDRLNSLRGTERILGRRPRKGSTPGEPVSKQEAVAVTLVSVLAVVPVMVGLYLFPANTASWIGIPGCPNDGPVASGSVNLTSADPVLMQRCEGLPLFHGIQFTVDSAVDLQGSFLNTGEGSIAIDAVAPNGQESFYWSCSYRGCSGSDVPFDVPVFPGTYLLFASGVCGVGGCQSGYEVATEPIVANFDRSLEQVSGSANDSVPAGGFVGWSIPAPPNATSFVLGAEMSTTACGYVLAVLSPNDFQAFQRNPGKFDFPNSTILEEGILLSCPWPYGAMEIGPGWYGPLNLSSSYELVFYNSGTTTGNLWSTPLEVSYILPTPD